MIKNSRDSIFKRQPLLIFFDLAFIFTWLILSPGVASTLGLIDFKFEGTVLTVLSGIGPLLAAVIVTNATEGRQGVARIFKSMFNWKVKLKWWAAAGLLLAILFTISAGLSLLMGGETPNLKDGIFLDGRNLAVVILLLLVGSFGEEPGWRGFALPRLQEGRSPLKAAIILTFFWWLWHLPTYWTLPYAMNAVQQFGFVAAYGIQFVVLFALSIACSWVFNGSGSSILMPIILHASWNFWSGAFGTEASLFLMPLFLLMAIVVAFATKGKLSYRREEV